MATYFTTLTSPSTPSITSPSNGATGVSRNPTITSSTFVSAESLTHTSSTWQIATDSGFSSVVWSKSADTTNKVSIVVNSTNGTFAGVLSGLTKLDVSTEYYVRVKYTDSGGDDSAYSSGISFTVRAAVVTGNAEDVTSYYDQEIPVAVSKKSTAMTYEITPSDSRIDGTIAIDLLTDAFYWRTNSAWKHIHDASVYATLTGTETLTNKTFTLPQINDTSSNHQYVFAVSELTADRTVTLPLLTGNDEFVFKDFTQTLTNKTLTTPTIGSFLNANHTHAAAGATGGTIDHTALTNLDSASYTHLTSTNHTDLTDAGDSTLHYHAADRDSANFTGTNWTDLTDTGATTLHKHDHGGQDGLGDDDHTQYVLRQPAADTVINDSGADFDFRIESDSEENMVKLDAGTDKIYLGGTTNGIEISKGGDLLLKGTAVYERHVQLDAKADGTVGNQPTQIDFYTVGGLQYPTTGSKYAFCQWEVPDDWDGGNVYFEIDWFPDSADTTGDDAVRWTVEYRAIAEGELVSNGTSVTLDNGAGGDTTDYSRYQTKHTRVTLVYNDANQPLTKQDHVYFKVSRDTAVANDFGGSVTVSAYEIIYNSTGFPTSN